MNFYFWSHHKHTSLQYKQSKQKITGYWRFPNANDLEANFEFESNKGKYEFAHADTNHLMVNVIHNSNIEFFKKALIYSLAFTTILK